jgi:hypothetical protein
LSTTSNIEVGKINDKLIAGYTETRHQHIITNDMPLDSRDVGCSSSKEQQQ